MRGDKRRLKCRFRATLEKRLSSLAYLYPCLHRSRAFPRRFRSTSPFLVFYFFLPPPLPPPVSLSRSTLDLLNAQTSPLHLSRYILSR